MSKDTYFFERSEAYKNNLMCIDEDGNPHTYQEMWDMGDKLIEQVPKGSLVLLLCSNDVQSLCLYLALLRKHCPVILIGKDTNQSFIDGIIHKYSPEFVLGNSKEVKRINNHGNYYSELALLLSTSGSTGASKLVRLSYENLQSNCDSIVEYLSLTSSERPITSLPMEYTYGLSVIHSHVAVGATIILTNLTLFNSEFWDKMTGHEVTSIAGVPYSYDMMFKRLRINEMDLPALKTLTQAGGRLNPELQEFIADWTKSTGRRFFVMYGQTEATARMSYLPPERCISKLGSVGIPIPGGRIEIEDDELVYYGNNVSLGYANTREDLALPDENKGRLLTGDMAYIDEDGYIFITGRKKRFIKLFGKRTSLDQVQEVLQEELDTDEIACTGVDDKIIEVWCGDDSVDVSKIMDIFAEKWEIRQKLVSVKRIDKIPRNSSGKILYKELKLDNYD